MWFNRTFMELKLLTDDRLLASLSRFNRTFMELKFQNRFALLDSQ